MEKRASTWQLIFIGILIISFFSALLLVIGRTLREAGEARPGRGKVAILPIEGVIVDSTKVIKRLRKLKKRKDVKALVLRIDSPGGSVGASQEIYQQIESVAKEKVVVASMANVAASGGYYIALPAKKIIANPGTITGSIGVLMQYLNLEGLLEKLAVKEISVKSGKNKDIGNPLKELPLAQRKILQSVSDNIHQQFKRAVEKHRHLSKAELLAVSDGRIFSGEQAKKLKLVDELGNLETAIESAGKLAKIEGKPKVIWLKEKKELWRKVLTADPEEMLSDFLSMVLTKLSLRADFL